MTNVRERVLLLGSGGMLGGYIAQELTAKQTPLTVDRQPLANRLGCDCVRIDDIADWPRAQQAISRVDVDVIINCIAVTSPSAIAADPARAIEINGVLPQRLAALAHNTARRLIHISTDGVFSGKRGNYSEIDRPDAEDMYGLSKRIGEPTVGSSISLRTTFYGFSGGNKSLLHWLAGQRGRTINGYAGYLMTALPARRLAAILSAMCSAKHMPNGVYHLPGPSMSKFDLLDLVNRRYGYDVEIVKVNTPVVDRRLKGSRIFELIGMMPASAEELLSDLDDDYRATLGGTSCGN